MLQHRVEIIKTAVYQSGYSTTKLAQKLGKSLRWMYLLFENNNVSLDVILQIGEIIHHDFSQEIKGLKTISQIVNDNLAPYNSEEFKNAEYWKNKYLNLLEEYNALLRDIRG